MSNPSRPNLTFSKFTDMSMQEMDSDDMMERVRIAMKEKEKLEHEKERKMVEVDFWRQILSSQTVTELNDIITSSGVSSFCALLDEKDRESVRKCHSLTLHIQCLRFLEGVTAHPAKDDKLLLRFPRPHASSSTFATCLVLLTPSQDDSFRVEHHNLPSTVPVAKFEEKYLKKEDTQDGLKKFVTSLYQYIRPLYNRQMQISTLQEAMPGLGVHCNHGCTTVNFILGLHDEGDSYEIIMDYDPCDILPLATTYKIVEGDIPVSKRPIKEFLQDLCLELQKEPLPQIIFSFLGKTDTQGEEEGESEGEKSASIELFGDI